MKKVLIFSLAYFPKHVGGAEVAIKEITDRIPDIEFHMVTNRFDSTLPTVEKIGNVLVHRIGITTQNPTMGDLKKFPLNLNKPLYQFWAAWKAWRLHREHHFDATWAMMAHSTGVPAALFNMVKPQVPFVLTLQEGDPIEYIEKKMWPLWPLFSRAFTRATVVQAISNFLGAWARKRNFTGRLEIIPNAVNTAHFSQEFPHKAIDDVKIALNKKMGDVFVITTSRLVHKNAVDDMIRALPLLPNNVYFVVLGTGPDEAMLKKLAVDSKVIDRVKFVGQVGHSEMPLYLKASDIFIRASRSEGMGNSFVEAMAAGLPVVATQEGGIADFLFDEKRNPEKPITGWAVDKNSPEQIVMALTDIMAHPEKARAVIATAKAMVVEKYDWEIVAKNMNERVFSQLWK